MSKYQDALSILRSRSRPWLLQQPNFAVKNKPNNFLMKEWLATLGYKDLDRLDVIHITGTKGKGTTAAFTSSLLQTYYRRRGIHQKIGLYTSPHLLSERERIQIDADPISEESFTRYFFYVWNTLRRYVNRDADMPGYLQLLALMSIHAFHSEAVTSVIYEVHAGGLKDATNIFDRVIACGFTVIGLDHIDLLGGSVESIAQHKAGIIKKGSTVVLADQTEPNAEKIICAETTRLGCSFRFSGPWDIPDYPHLRQDFQKRNMRLAIDLSNAFLSATEKAELIQQDIAVAARLCSVPGRFQKITRDTTTLFLDIAHNYISLPLAFSSFKDEIDDRSKSPVRRVLIFGHESDARSTTDMIHLMSKICTNTCPIDVVILSPYRRYGIPFFTSPQKHAALWRSLQPGLEIICAESTAQALTFAQYEPSIVLVTGSTYLVGDVLSLLK